MGASVSVRAVLEIATALEKQPLFEGSGTFRSLHDALCSALARMNVNALPLDRRGPFQRLVRRIKEVHSQQSNTFLLKDLATLRDVLRSYWQDVRRDDKLMTLLVSEALGKPVDLGQYSEQAITLNRRLLIDEGFGEAITTSNGEYLTILGIKSVKHNELVVPTNIEGQSQQLPQTFVSYNFHGNIHEAAFDSSVQKEIAVSRDTYELSGTFTNSNVNLNATLTGVIQTISSAAVGEDATRSELASQVKALKEALSKVPPAKREDAEAIAETTKDLFEKVVKPEPNRKAIQITAKGLKDAAEAIAESIPIVASIVATVGKIVGF